MEYPKGNEFNAWCDGYIDGLRCARDFAQIYFGFTNPETLELFQKALEQARKDIAEAKS